MEEKIKKVIQSAFDEASVGYDAPALKFFDKSAHLLAQALPLKRDEHVLDVATGTGKIALALASRIKDGHVVGVDLSPGMLREAEEKATRAHLKNISFQLADVDDINFSPPYFDGLTCGFGVHFWPAMEKSLSRLIRFVKEGGFIAITSFAKGSFEPHASLCLKQFERYGVKLPKTYSVERLDAPDKNIALFKKVELMDISSRTMSIGYYLEQPGDWWDLVRYTGYRAFLNQLNPDQQILFQKEFIDFVKLTRKSQGIYLNIDVIVTLGIVKGSR